MVKIASNQAAAQAAASGINKVSVSSGYQCTLEKSNLSGMKKRSASEQPDANEFIETCRLYQYTSK